jgi:pyruvate/2-oxoglutarate dehydrogenase complex dihydrolipoamide acyltransferase (E2) component
MTCMHLGQPPAPPSEQDAEAFSEQAATPASPPAPPSPAAAPAAAPATAPASPPAPPPPAAAPAPTWSWSRCGRRSPSNGCSPLGRRMITRTGAGRCRLMHGGYGHGAGTSAGRLRVFSSIQAAMSLGPKRFGPSDAPGPGTPATQRAATPRAHPPPGARSPGRFCASPASPSDGKRRYFGQTGQATP